MVDDDCRAYFTYSHFNKIYRLRQRSRYHKSQQIAGNVGLGAWYTSRLSMVT